VTSSITWPFQPLPIWPFPIGGPLERIESLNPAVFEILPSKRIGVTSLTFQGHVTLSVTSAFDSPYAISYWWPFGTKSLSLTVSEIFNVKCNAMFDVTLIRPLNKGQDHSFWYQSISHIRLTAIIQITSQTTLGVLQLCLGTPLREGQNLVGACTTQIHTHGSWNEAAAISHSSCTVRFISTLEKRRHRADLLEVFRMYKGLSLTPFCRYFTLSHVSNTRGHSVKVLKNHCSLDLRRFFFIRASRQSMEQFTTACDWLC